MLCVFCKSPLNQGATVCAHCGATMRHVGARAGASMILLGAVAMGFSALMALGLVLVAVQALAGKGSDVGPFGFFSAIAFFCVLPGWFGCHLFNGGKAVGREAQWCRY